MIFLNIFFLPFYLGQTPFEVFIDVVYFKHFIVYIRSRVGEITLVSFIHTSILCPPLLTR